MQHSATWQRVPRLHLITNRMLCRERAQAAIVAEAAVAGVGAVQLREKDLAQPDLSLLAQELQGVLPAMTALIVNGSVAVAQAVGAAGVHLPEAGPSVAAVREQLGVHVLIGRSVHDLAGAVAAAKAGVDYLIVGTVFATASKPGREPAGLSLLREVTAVVDVPVIAIGGINVGNARRVIAAGAWGVAVMSGILAAPKPAQAVVDLLACLEEGEADD